MAEQHPEHTHGLEELSSGAVRYRAYLFGLIEPLCGHSILEIGAGLGDFASHFGPDRSLTLTDADADCVATLKERFAGRDNVGVTQLDLTTESLASASVDTVLAINVLEHIPDDVTALRAMAGALGPGGRVVLFVPGYPSLYGPFDRAVGHHRRYTPRTLRAAVESAGMHVDRLHPVNFIGGIAWWVAVRLGKQHTPRAFLVRLYDRVLVPIVRLMERRWRPPFGQSVLCVARPRS